MVFKCNSTKMKKSGLFKNKKDVNDNLGSKSQQGTIDIVC
jgi:hypothetical protein